MTAEKPASTFDTSPEAQSRRGKRRHGTRSILSEQLFKDLVVSWEEQGPAALARMAFHDFSGYVNMVARLMPQKIEHSTPTDGLTDERLAHLLDLADAALDARRPLTIDATAISLPNHEKTLGGAVSEEGVGGPECVGDAAGGGSTHTTRDAIADTTPHQFNGLKNSDAPIAENANKLNTVSSVYDDRTPTTPFSESHQIPHPVGRPFPKPDHDVERSNKAALSDSDEEPIDPASLF